MCFLCCCDGQTHDSRRELFDLLRRVHEITTVLPKAKSSGAQIMGKRRRIRFPPTMYQAWSGMPSVTDPPMPLLACQEHRPSTDAGCLCSAVKSPARVRPRRWEHEPLPNLLDWAQSSGPPLRHGDHAYYNNSRGAHEHVRKLLPIKRAFRFSITRVRTVSHPGQFPHIPNPPIRYHGIFN